MKPPVKTSPPFFIDQRVYGKMPGFDQWIRKAMRLKLKHEIVYWDTGTGMSSLLWLVIGAIGVIGVRQLQLFLWAFLLASPAILLAWTWRVVVRDSSVEIHHPSLNSISVAEIDRIEVGCARGGASRRNSEESVVNLVLLGGERISMVTFRGRRGKMRAHDCANEMASKLNKPVLVLGS